MPVAYPVPAGAEHRAGRGAFTLEKALSDALTPWREKYPQVPVAHTVDLARPSTAVLKAAAQAGLVVVGRRMHRPALGMRKGPVAHAVLHHAAAPVAVVPHG